MRTLIRRWWEEQWGQPLCKAIWQHLTSSPAPSTWQVPRAELGLRKQERHWRSRAGRGGAGRAVGEGRTSLEHGPHAVGDSRGYGLDTH